MFISMDWFKGKFTGNHVFLPLNMGGSCKFSPKPIHGSFIFHTSRRNCSRSPCRPLTAKKFLLPAASGPRTLKGVEMVLWAPGTARFGGFLVWIVCIYIIIYIYNYIYNYIYIMEWVIKFKVYFFCIYSIYNMYLLLRMLKVLIVSMFNHMKL